MSPYALSVFGGVQEQVLAMSRELSRRGILVQVIAPDSHDLTTYDTPARIERFGRLISIPANGSRAPLTLSVAASRRAARRIHEFDPQVVHFHEPFAPLVGWSTLREHNAAAVGTFHRSGEGPAVSMAAPFLRRWAHHLDINAAVSEQAAATAHSSCGVQTKVLFNGFEATRFVEFDREQQPIATVVVLGRLESRKGVMTAIEAVRAHNERHENPWRLVIIGDGPERTSLVAAGGTDGAVQFLGAVSDIEKRRWYRRADVLVAPATHGESFGLILLEAMASETPVVASDIPGYRDAAGAHALLFAPGNSASLEQAISMSLARDHWNPGPALLHAEHWSMSRLVDDYFTLYQSARERFGALR